MVLAQLQTDRTERVVGVVLRVRSRLQVLSGYKQIELKVNQDNGSREIQCQAEARYKQIELKA